MGARDATANLAGTVISSPPNPHFRIVSEHEAIRGRFHGQTVDLTVTADQAVFDAVRQIADHAAFEHDAVLDLRIANFGALADRREWPDVGVHDPRIRANHDRAADDRPLDNGAGFDDDLPLDTRLRVHRSGHVPGDRIEDQAVGFEHVLELARVFPPAVHQ